MGCIRGLTRRIYELGVRLLNGAVFSSPSGILVTELPVAD